MHTIRSLGRGLALSVSLGVLLFGGCAKKPPSSAAASRPPVQAAPAAAVSPPPAAAPTHDLQAEVLSQDLATINRKGYLADAFFDYDRAELRDDARGQLARDSDWLRKFPSVRVLLEGHCDDRGTEAYNLALGERRAAAAREYLESLGVPADRIQTVSYGKERPFCQSDADPCWQQNRRDHFVVTAK